jgi:hypothetical protein
MAMLDHMHIEMIHQYTNKYMFALLYDRTVCNQLFISAVCDKRY